MRKKRSLKEIAVQNGKFFDSIKLPTGIHQFTFCGKDGSQVIVDAVDMFVARRKVISMFGEKNWLLKLGGHNG